MTAGFVTEWGNLAVTGPGGVAAVLAVWLLVGRTVAGPYGLTILAVFTATVLLKLVSARFGGSVDGGWLHFSHGAPSGHMGMALAVYGGAALLCTELGRGWLRVCVPAVAVALIAAIGVTRVVVHAHTPTDVVAALFVAGLPLYWLHRRIAAAGTPGNAALWVMLLALSAASGLAHATGLRFDSSTGILSAGF